LKRGDEQSSVGSNPTLSANIVDNYLIYMELYNVLSIYIRFYIRHFSGYPQKRKA
jgi:hypothetical protein